MPDVFRHFLIIKGKYSVAGVVLVFGMLILIWKVYSPGLNLGGILILATSAHMPGLNSTFELSSSFGFCLIRGIPPRNNFLLREPFMGEGGSEAQTT